MANTENSSENLYKTRKSHRVVVTGLGVVSPLGLNLKDTWQGLIEDRSGIRNISTSDWEGKVGAKNSGVDVAGLVIGFDASKYFPKKELNRIHRSAQFSAVAGREALIQAGFLDDNSLGKKTHQTFHKMRELIEYIKQLTHTNESK